MNELTLMRLSEILKGKYYGEVRHDLVINNFEITPALLEPTNYSTTAFISISKTRWDLEMGKQTSWKDGNVEILSHWEKCALIITEAPISELEHKIRAATLLLNRQPFYINNYAAAHTVYNTSPQFRIAAIVGTTYETNKNPAFKEKIDKLIVDSAMKFHKEAIFWHDWTDGISR